MRNKATTLPFWMLWIISAVLGIFVGIMGGCAATKPSAEGWQDTPSAATLYKTPIKVIVISFFGHPITIRILDQSGDVGGGSADQGDAEAKTDAKVDVEASVTPSIIP